MITTITSQRETALCYQHYFCNTDLRTALITKIKGLSIQTQQNTFVLFTLLKLTSDERKTLTKISMRKTSHNHSPKNTARSVCKATRKPIKGCLHNWWRIRSIRISSRNNGRIKKTTRLVLYKTLHYFALDYLHFFCTKTQVKYYKFCYEIQKYKTLFSTRGNYSSAQVRNSKSKTLSSTQGNCCKFQLQN